MVAAVNGHRSRSIETIFAVHVDSISLGILADVMGPSNFVAVSNQSEILPERVGSGSIAFYRFQWFRDSVAVIMVFGQMKNYFAVFSTIFFVLV